MSPPSYKQNKKHIYLWRESNKEQYNQICRKSKQKYDAWKKVQKEFLNILL
jgi:hypothetical protein